MIAHNGLIHDVPPFVPGIIKDAQRLHTRTYVHKANCIFNELFHNYKKNNLINLYYELAIK